MSYLALYRKYRPQTFEQVIGQQHIVQTLENQIKNNSVSHAYLFCGTRGTGKTSCAKIFAKAINCQNPINGSPCFKCDACKAYEDANNLDIIEIDAASNNRVDEIRDLREKVGYMPTIGKYKVYIIDEVHMLTDSAFNALLKTLEEPPMHVVFILCTTEVHKLPATILSRCTRFDFKLVSNQELENHLKNVLLQSNIKFDDESIQVIAKAGQGSVRDTLSTAEMCASFCNNNLTYKQVIDCLGITNNQTLFNIAKSLITKDCKSLIIILNELYNKGKNINVVLKDLQNYFSNMLTVKFVDNANDLLKLPQEDYESLKQLSNNATEQQLLKFLSKLSSQENDLKQSLNSFVVAKAILLDCIISQTELEELKQRLDNLEKKTKNVEISDSVVEKASYKVAEETQVKQNSSTLSAKHIFGELIKNIKDNQNFMLYTSCGCVKDVKIENNKFVIVCEKNEYDIFENNKLFINQFLLKYGLELLLKLDNGESSNLDKDIEMLIKEAFNNKVKII